MDRDESGRSRPFHSQKEFRAHLKRGCWIASRSLLLVLELHGKFDFINDVMRAVSCVEI